MGVKIVGQFLGGLAMKLTHCQSKVEILTDPPLDNGGEGKSFSPTDLIAAGVGSCMMSVMAIHAKKESIDLTGMSCEIEKHMSADLPRRIVQIDVCVRMPRKLTSEQRVRLEGLANQCPVIVSLHPSIKIDKTYLYEVTH